MTATDINTSVPVQPAENTKPAAGASTAAAEAASQEVALPTSTRVDTTANTPLPAHIPLDQLLSKEFAPSSPKPTQDNPGEPAAAAAPSPPASPSAATLPLQGIAPQPAPVKAENGAKAPSGALAQHSPCRLWFPSSSVSRVSRESDGCLMQSHQTALTLQNSPLATSGEYVLSWFVVLCGEVS